MAGGLLLIYLTGLLLGLCLVPHDIAGPSGSHHTTLKEYFRYSKQIKQLTMHELFPYGVHPKATHLHDILLYVTVFPDQHLAHTICCTLYFNSCVFITTHSHNIIKFKTTYHTVLSHSPSPLLIILNAIVTSKHILRFAFSPFSCHRHSLPSHTPRSASSHYCNTYALASYCSLKYTTLCEYPMG